MVNAGTNYKVNDLKLAREGKLKIDWAVSRMPTLARLCRKFSNSKPLEGIRVAGCLHVTKETAVLVKALKTAGAEASWCGCNPLSTQDDVAAALATEKFPIYAWRGLSTKDYYWCIDKVLEIEPNVTIDDGADLVFRIHKDYTHLIPGLLGGCEETTTGIQRIHAMHKAGALKYPIISVSHAETKWDFDNVFGTGQSSFDGIIRSTNVMIAGKRVVVAGYGRCGTGVAMRAKGFGASVIVTEPNPVRALRAVMNGFEVMPMAQAARLGDIFVTTTGCKNVIDSRHFKLMKDGAILANAGHFNAEINVQELGRAATSKREIRPNNVEYTMPGGRRLYLLAEGRLVNLAAAEGHPSEVMDLSFANQFLSVIRLAKEGKSMKPGVYEVSREQDELVARTKLETIGVKLEHLSREQKEYMESFSEGT